MRLRDDSRGASTQLGAILLFGMLVLAVAFWQAQVVPSENAEVEFDHNQRVQDDMQEVRSAIVSAPGSSSPSRSVSVDLAPSYPPRALFANPRVPGGTIRTIQTSDERANLTLVNATAIDGETADYWNGSNRTFNTGGLVYVPGYAVYTDAPDTVYENSVLYNELDDANVTLAGQSLVDGRRITLVALNGSLQRTQTGSYTLDLRAVSASTRTVSVTNTSGNLTIAFATQLNASQWATLLEAEAVSNGGHVLVDQIDQRPSPVDGMRVVEVPLEGNVTYELRLAKVGVGSGVAEEDAHYIVDSSGNETTIGTGGSQQLVVEVRDRFNNPVSGATVTVDEVTQGSVTPADTATTGEAGRASFTFTSSTTGTAEITFNITKDADLHENVTFQVEVTAGDGGGSGPGGTSCTGGTGDAAYFVCWEDPSGQTGTSACGTDACTLNASASLTMDLTATTTATAQDATVDYAVNNSSVAGLSPWSAPTDDRGKNTTTFQATANGSVAVYAASGGTGDRINVSVVAFPRSSFVVGFNDGLDGEPESSAENESIPVGEVGNVSSFQNMRAANDTFGFLDEENTKNANNPEFNLDVGFRITNIPSRSSQTLEIRYRSNVSDPSCVDDGEDYTVTPIDASGNTIDSTYTLPNTGGTIQTETFELSAAEVSNVNSNGELLLSFEDANANDPDFTCYDVFHIRVLTPL